MKCPKCGHEVAVGTDTCNACGTRLRWGHSVTERSGAQWTGGRTSTDGTNRGQWRKWLAFGVVAVAGIYLWNKYPDPEPVDAKVWIGLWLLSAVLGPWVVFGTPANGFLRWWHRFRMERGRK